jgi:hypothetical protein
VFDHRDHLHHADARRPYLWHLRLSPTTYRLLCGHRLLYHNRLFPGEVMKLFEAAGFERIAVRRLVLPDHCFVDTDEAVLAGEPGIARDALSARFWEASDVDLRTAAAHYLYRKPVG